MQFGHHSTCSDQSKIPGVGYTIILLNRIICDQDRGPKYILLYQIPYESGPMHVYPGLTKAAHIEICFSLWHLLPHYPSQYQVGLI